jgi:hypothetical protein
MISNGPWLHECWGWAYKHIYKHKNSAEMLALATDLEIPINAISIDLLQNALDNEMLTTFIIEKITDGYQLVYVKVGPEDAEE